MPFPRKKRVSHGFRAASDRCGFTLVELLVVIAIIGILVSLLLPAVQAAREAARRSQCVNHMKQLALACLNFESTSGKFPTAGGAVGQFLDPAEAARSIYGVEAAGWMYQILPYIEEQALFDLREGDGSGNAGFIDTGLIERPVTTFNCPSRSNRFAIDGIDLYRVGCYAGVMASWHDEGWFPGGFQWQSTAPPAPNEEDVVWTGILAKGGHVNNGDATSFGRIGFSQITDGSSKTILLAEKAVWDQNSPVNTEVPPTGYPYWELRGYYVGADWATMRMFAPLPPDGGGHPGGEVGVRGDSDARNVSSDPRRPSAGPPPPENGFGAAHPGVFVTCFGDGSARVLSNDADLFLLDSLGKRADGVVVAVDDL